jgi:hypothetical protein
MPQIPLFEMFDRYLRSLEQSGWSAGAAVALAVLFVATVRQPLQANVRALLRTGAIAVAIAFGLAWAWQLRWLCDDAFISFRYAENLARGHGLVFNAGERIEGYTNFLWTFGLAGTRVLGLDIPKTSVVLSLLSFAALIALTARVSTLVRPDDGRGFLPLAAVLCAAQYTLASFGTSGLETMFGAMLVMLAIERALRGSYVLSGLAGVAAAMTHPDHGIFYAALGIALLLDPERRRGLVRYAVPFAVLYLPYFAWRFHYYGDLFPNTYYAKSANLTYFQQGGIYLLAFLVGSGLWVALPAVVHGGHVLRSTLLGRFCLFAVPLFCLYVAKVGGDFMYGRLLTPLVAPLLVLAEVSISSLLARRRFVTGAAFALLLVAVALPTRILRPMEKRWHLSDERTFYELDSFDPVRVKSMYFDWGQALLEHFPAYADSPRLAMYCVGMIGYLTGLPLVDNFGLTDRVVAHTPVASRGRPGHEKHAAPAYIVARDVDISDVPTYPKPYQQLTQLRLGKITLHLVHYDPKVIALLKDKKGVQFTDFERHLKTRMRRPVSTSNAEQAACDTWFAEQYYFSRVPSSPWRAQMQRQLLAAGQPPGNQGSERFDDFRRTHAPHAQSAMHFETDERDRYDVTGLAFLAFPAYGAAPNQHMVTGHQGGLVNTYAPGLGDGARGVLLSKPFRLVGDVMELRVGGGAHSEQLRVSLVVGGTRVFSTAGCKTEMMGTRLWQIAPHKGQDAVLEIVDDAVGDWGHILVDEVVQWVKKPDEQPSAATADPSGG